jgi:hypothetical protein
MPDDEVITKTELSVALAFFLLLALAGIWLGGVAVQDFARARASVSWPESDGVVLSPRENGFRYAYVANGSSYESGRVRFLTANFLTAKFEKPQPGAPLIVRYNPENGAEAVLIAGGSGGVFALIVGLAGLLLFVGLGGLIRTILIGRALEEDDDDAAFSGDRVF